MKTIDPPRFRTALYEAMMSLKRKLTDANREYFGEELSALRFGVLFAMETAEKIACVQSAVARGEGTEDAGELTELLKELLVVDDELEAIWRWEEKPW